MAEVKYNPNSQLFFVRITQSEAKPLIRLAELEVCTVDEILKRIIDIGISTAKQFLIDMEKLENG